MMTSWRGTWQQQEWEGDRACGNGHRLQAVSAGNLKETPVPAHTSNAIVGVEQLEQVDYLLVFRCCLANHDPVTDHLNHASTPGGILDAEHLLDSFDQFICRDVIRLITRWNRPLVNPCHQRL